jgi:hypothetical protein
MTDEWVLSTTHERRLLCCGLSLPDCPHAHTTLVEFTVMSYAWFPMQQAQPAEIQGEKSAEIDIDI